MEIQLVEKDQNGNCFYIENPKSKSINNNDFYLKVQVHDWLRISKIKLELLEYLDKNKDSKVDDIINWIDALQDIADELNAPVIWHASEEDFQEMMTPTELV